MNEQRILGYCECCDSEITDDDDFYVNEDGERFCSIECVLEFYHIEKVEA